MIRLYVMLFAGVAACAMAANLVKASAVEPVRLAAGRLCVAVIALLPVFVRDWRANRGRFGVRDLAAAVWPGLLLAAHFIAWIEGARQTQAANATLLVNLTPAVLPFFTWALCRERIARGETVGTAVGLVGVALLVGADFRMSPASFVGDLICLLAMILFAWYFALGRVNRRAPTVWLYIVPVYAVAAVACVPFMLLQPQTSGLDWSREIWPLLGLGLGSTVLGHGTLNYCVRHMRPQVVSLAHLTQFIFAGVVAWIAAGEVPGRATYAAAVLTVAGAAIAIRSGPGGR